MWGEAYLVLKAFLGSTCRRKIMCIENVSGITKESGVGWKVFLERDGELHSVFHPHTPSYPVNKWIRENDFRDMRTKHKRGVRVPCWAKKTNYPLGFHVFLSREKATKFMGEQCTPKEVVKKVEYRRAHTQGELNFFRYVRNAKTIVAKEMRVLG